MMHKLFLLFLVLLIIFKPSFAANSDTITYVKRKYVTQRITSSQPVIDGLLNDDCWKEGKWEGNYRQFMPNEGDEPSKETEIKILYDEENIFVAIRAYDDIESIDNQMGRRDDFVGDIVGVCFDSYYDHRTGFEFDLTAAGCKLDVLLLNDRWDTNWDAVWYGKVGMEDSAWVAEMQIPLTQLRYGNKEDQVWGMHAWRWINRNQEEDQWNLMPRDNPGFLYSIGEIHGIKGIEKNKRIEFLPYTVGKIKTYPPESGNPYADGFDPGISFGIDGKIGITSDFTVDYTINPDFGQVEADPSVLNLSAFETYYEEKRPFFLEGRNIFDFNYGGDQLFYSRRIGHSPSHYPSLDDNEYAKQPENTSIISALKLSGKTKDGLSIGIIESITANEYALIDSSGSETKEKVEPLSNYFVGRLQKDINESNTIIGGMITAVNRDISDIHLNFLNSSAITGGIDAKHYWNNKTYYIDFQGVFSQINGDELAIYNAQKSSSRYYQRPDADYLSLDSTKTSLSGYGTRLSVGKGSNGKWRFRQIIVTRSPGLELNDIGYQQSADNIKTGTMIGYEETEPKSIFRNYSIYTNADIAWDYGGEYINTFYYNSFNIQFKNKWSFNYNFNRSSKINDTRLLRGGPAFNLKGFWCQSLWVGTDYSKVLAFGFSYHFHRYDDKLSKIDDFSPEIVYKLTKSLKIFTTLNYSRHKNNYQWVDFDNDIENQYLLAFLDQKTLGIVFRIDYAINPELTIQYYGNPYISVGNYSKYKLITNPGTENISDQYYEFSDNELVLSSDNTYQIPQNSIGIDNAIFTNPDFNFRQFPSNLVARWEYKPGSALYLVWSMNMSESEETSNFQLMNNVKTLFNSSATNIFLVKFNYWFSL